MGKISCKEGWISSGPWGGEDGVDWAYKLDGPIMQISIRYGKVIESIVFESKSCDGIVMGGSEKIGGNGGYETKTFCIDSSVEQVSSIFLTYGEFNKQVTIHSLCINTNLNEYGASGSRSGASSMSIPVEGGVLVGFHGRLANHITAIGIFVAPHVNSLPSPQKKVDSLLSTQDPDSAPSLLKGKISREEAEQNKEINCQEGWISLGPGGGRDGKAWAYQPDGPILQICILYGDVIDSIVFASKSYDGVVIGSPKKIGYSTGGHVTNTICIDTSAEQLLSISLTYQDFFGEETIISLSVHTNLNNYGPFGAREAASCVQIPIVDGVFAGFHGRVGMFITAIGILVAPKINSLVSIQDLDFAPKKDLDAPTQHKGKISGEEGWISSGPWGGEDGVDWAYKLNGPIMQINIRYGEVIDSIVFESISCDGIVIGGSKKIGGDGGYKTKTFCIDSSIEQVSSILLTYGVFNKQVTIHSLCINTNLKEYGASGSRSGPTSRSIPVEGGVLVGFHGRLANHITAIGIFVAPKVNSLPSPRKKVDSLLSVQDPDSAPSHLKGKISNKEAKQKDLISSEEEWISLRPWGSKYGAYWAYKLDGPILQICILYGQVIDSIVFASKSYDGVVIGSPKKIGDSTGGHVTKTICIDTSAEQLLSISLTYQDFWGEETIISLSMHTNLNNYGPFGAREAASCVCIPIVGGVFTGFHGHVGRYITAIGIFVAPKFNSLVSIQDVDSAPKKAPDVAPTQHKGKISDKQGLISIGPWGGKDGEDWAYKYDGPIMQINICYGEAINSLSFLSRSCDGLPIGSTKKFGDTGGCTTEMFCIDSSVEQLSSISSTREHYNGKTTITSLCFNTNVKTYGPFGTISSSSQFIPIKGGVIAGFHGRIDTYLTAIGIFLAPEVNSLHSIQGLEYVPTQLKESWKPLYQKDRSPSFEMNRKHFHLVDEQEEALQLVNSAFDKYKIHMDKQISEARKKLEELKQLGSIELREFAKLGKDITKLKLHIPLTSTNQDYHHGGTLSPAYKLIRSDLVHVDTAFEEAKESMYHMNVKINQAHEKFKELQILASSQRDSDELRKADSDQKQKVDCNELRKAIAKLKVQVNWHNKRRSADSNLPRKSSANSNLRRKNWDNINGAEEGMMHFFYKEPKVVHAGDFDGLLEAFRKLPKPLRCCLSCFFKFPPMATIKRTPMIYLWIGQGYISPYLHPEGSVSDIEAHADNIFDELIEKGFIEPIYQNFSLVPDSYRMNLSVRSSLYREAELRRFTSNGALDLDLSTVCDDLIRNSSCLINVGETLISCDPQVFKNMKHIRSLYLGRWQSSATHHIELANAKLLHELNKLHSLTFLSLRGISTIMELPTVISELKGLMILDLRACFNLEVIPNEIGLLKSLTHLDISECYFLENMPKSLAQLSNLQILKGFLIRDFKNKKQSCALLDLSSLQKLRKLNICISKDLPRLQDLKYLERFEVLKKLTISWGRLQARDEVIAKAFHFATLPPRLEKLDLQCFPMTRISNWLMPGKLKELKKLYIRGGQLGDLGEIQKHQEEQWTVEILRFEYLSELELHWKELRILFPKLIYLHQVQCPKFLSFQCDERGVWMNKEAIDTHMQLQKYVKFSGMIGSSSTSGSGPTLDQNDSN